MNIEQLLEEWEKDCGIDDNHLDRSSIETAKLHSKYLNILMMNKIKATSINNEYNNLRQKKFRYYRGEMTKEELQENGWSQWQGTKPIKSEMDEFLRGDADLNKLILKQEYLKVFNEGLESILNQIKSRDWQIRNAVSFKQFLAGS